MAARVGHDSHVHLIPHLEGLDQRKEIGRGSFGAVYEVKMNGLPCIAKGLHDILLGHGGNLPIREADKEAIRVKFHDECALLGNLKHPNIVQFLGVHRSKDNDEWLVMEYLHMDLAKCLKMYPDIPLPLKLSILRDVSYGLLHLHSQAPPIIHRDLTAPNILLTQGMSAKIADLGVSKVFDMCQVQQSAHTKAPGTLAYMPPEALSPDPKYDAKLDVFSYGVVTLYVANQEFPIVYEPPIPPLVTKKQEIQICKRKPWVDKMGVAHPLQSVVMSCLKDRPDHRPTSKELNDIITKLCTQNENSCENVLEVEKQLEQVHHVNKVEKQLEQLHHVYKLSNLTSNKWLADQIAKLQHDLGEQEQKTTEAQSTLHKCESENKHLIADIARISEENNAVLDEAAKKHAAEKETLQTEMELYQTQAVMYKEDFEQERKDRENMHARVVNKEEELARIRQQLEEELQTMNQQLDMYKKQVDSYKAELEKCHVKVLSSHAEDLVVALFSYEAQGDKELNFKEGDIITVVSKVDDVWWSGKIENRSGFFPVAYVEPHTGPLDDTS